MAKKLLTTYTFTPGIANVGRVVVPGTYTLEQFLLVTNVTSGTVLYQFNVAAKGGSISSSGGNTTLTLEADTSAMSSGDRLQVYVDDGADSGGLTDAQLRASAVPISGTVTPNVQLGAGVATGTTQRVTLASDGPAVISLSSIDSKTATLVSGRVPVDGSAVTQPISNASLTSIDNKLPALSGGLVPVVATPAALQTFSYSQSGVIALNTIAIGPLDCVQARSILIHCTSIGTSGAITPEWSADQTTWLTSTISSQSLGTAASGFTSTGIYFSPVLARYLRFRVSTATTAGTTTLYVSLSDAPLPLSSVSINGSPTVLSTFQSYAANGSGAATASAVSSPATPAATQLKATGGRVVNVTLYNSAASSRFLKMFNATAASVTLGTTAAAYELVIPPNQTLEISQEGGLGHATAITYAITAARGLTDNTATGLAAGDVVGIIGWA